MIGESGGGATGVPLSWQLSPGATIRMGFRPYLALQGGRRGRIGHSGKLALDASRPSM
jgi:hypothetical protein